MAVISPEEFRCRPAIPVARPLLPAADALLPYLRRIDQTRIYSNVGPLIRELEERLAQHFSLPSGSIATVANATLGLTLTLQALGARPGSLCLMPAWTFAASGHAAVAAGLRPYFLDVDADDWCIKPAGVMSAIDRLGPAQVGAVMPVAPFGGRVNTAAWDVFYEQTRIPVVIDAAAAFDSAQPGLVPAVVSLHATKVLGAGEGGFVMSRDRQIAIDIQRRANFGFYGAREARVPATNAKMSEYSAAVGLASLDCWPETRAQWMAAAMIYRKTLAATPEITVMPGLDGVASSTFLVQVESALGSVGSLAMDLARLGIATRRWWGNGLHEEHAFTGYGRDSLPVATVLGRQTIGLPCSRDLTRREIVNVCTGIATALQLHKTPALTVAAARGVRGQNVRMPGSATATSAAHSAVVQYDKKPALVPIPA
jgi:dTDP-4-amino-4,6-dideoxygalactose transaminase